MLRPIFELKPGNPQVYVAWGTFWQKCQGSSTTQGGEGGGAHTLLNQFIVVDSFLAQGTHGSRKHPIDGFEPQKRTSPLRSGTYLKLGVETTQSPKSVSLPTIELEEALSLVGPWEFKTNLKISRPLVGVQSYQGHCWIALFFEEHFWKGEDIPRSLGNPRIRKPPAYQKPPCERPLKNVFKLYNKLNGYICG